MYWRSLLLMPALLVLLAHSLIAHEHQYNGVIVPKFAASTQSGATLLNCFISADTGEEHLEMYMPGDGTPEINYQAGYVAICLYSGELTDLLPDISGNGLLPGIDHQPPLSPPYDRNSRRGPPAA